MKKFLIVSSVITLFLLTACDKNDRTPENPKPAGNPTEIITTAILQLTPTDTMIKSAVAVWKDEDGDGPKQPIIDTLTIQAGKTYNGNIILLNESSTPVDTISLEILEEEMDVHQFFYTVLGSLQPKISITKTDVDANMLPVGLNTLFTVNSEASGTDQLKIVLKHYDGISKTTDANLGETDMEIILPLKINQ